jgi:hypothetical protein
VANDQRTEDLVSRLRLAEAEHCRQRSLSSSLLGEAANEIERLKEIIDYPNLTPDASAEQFKAVLRDWEKGREVNSRDLIDALSWRVRNQSREIARLHERLKVTL